VVHSDGRCGRGPWLAWLQTVGCHPGVRPGRGSTVWSAALTFTRQLVRRLANTAEGKEIVASEVLKVRQRGLRVKMRNTAVSLENPLGGYLWRGQFRIHDREQLIGWYTSLDPAVTAKGSMYFRVNPAGKFLVGRWIGCNYDSTLASGYGVIAQERSFAVSKLREICS
jgi:hypothetical protein